MVGCFVSLFYDNKEVINTNRLFCDVDERTRGVSTHWPSAIFAENILRLFGWRIII